MKQLEIHPSVQLAWAIADAEAKGASRSVIEPVHFLMGILKVVDRAFARELDRYGIAAGIAQEIGAVAEECRAMLGLADDEIAAARRRLREPGHAPVDAAGALLHRSEGSRRLFVLASERAQARGSSELTIADLLRGMLSDPPTAACFLRDRAKPEEWEGRGGVPGTTAHCAKTPILDEFGRDLTALARAGRLAPVVGRRPEMTLLVRYLRRTSKRNVILIGAAGVGKTAVVEGLAQLLRREDTPEFLRDLRIVQISVSDLVAGTKYRGDMEARLKGLIDEVSSDPNVVLFLDEIHLVVKAGTGGDAPLDIANTLKPALARDDFRCIGATTTDEYERYIKGDGALTRRFQVLSVDEPSRDAAREICRAWARRIEEIQSVVIEDDAIEAALALSSDYIRNRPLPDKAIDLLENAAVYAKIPSLSFHRAMPSKQPPRIGRGEIEDVLEEQYGVAIRTRGALDVERAASALRSELVGQDRAIAELVHALAALGETRMEKGRPLGVLLFTGPTGVGKTFAAECLARDLFGRTQGVLGRFNMSEYKERHELARLIGAPPGFIGHEQAGALFRFVEAHPQGLILLDEMEKAHSEIHDYFLQVFDKGEATDSRGRLADLSNYLFVMTCNIYDVQRNRPPMGFHSGSGGARTGESIGDETQLRRSFRPEFLARIDRVIEFQPLDAAAYESLLRRKLDALFGAIAQEQGKRTRLGADAMKGLCDACVKQEDGVRGFTRLFERLFVVPLHDYLRLNPDEQSIDLGWAGGKLVFPGTVTTDGIERGGSRRTGR